MHQLILASLLSIIPFERDAPRLDRYEYVTSRYDESDHYSTRYGGDTQRNLYWRGFSFNNRGPNHIVKDPPQGMETPWRLFTFESDDYSRQGTHIWITDYNGSGHTSDYFESMFVFLPRHSAVHIEEEAETLLVTLPTGEVVNVFKKYKTLDTPLLTEEPVDLNPNRSQRKFPQIHYHGQGVVIRSDARGADPRNVKSVRVIKSGQEDCIAPAKLFWNQGNHPLFKFASDEEAYEVIKEVCGPEYLPEI